jgi:hypothetical protein
MAAGSVRRRDLKPSVWVATERERARRRGRMTLQVLAYNLRRALNILGSGIVLEAVRAWESPRARRVAPWMAARAAGPLSARSDPIDKGIERQSCFRGSIWPQTDGMAQLGRDYGTRRGVLARPGA